MRYYVDGFYRRHRMPGWVIQWQKLVFILRAVAQVATELKRAFLPC